MAKNKKVRFKETFETEYDRDIANEKRRRKVRNEGTPKPYLSCTQGDEEYVDFMRELDFLILNDSEEEEEEDDDDGSDGGKEKDEGSTDKQYERFLKNLRIDGNSYVLSIPGDNAFVKYEERNKGLSSGCPRDKKSSTRRGHVSTGTSVGSRVKLRSRHKKVNADLAEKEQCKLRKTNEGSKLAGKPKRATGFPTSDFKVEFQLEKKMGPAGVKSECNKGIGGENSSKRPKAEPTLDEDEWWFIINGTKCSGFRERLVDSLKRPYNEEEYNWLSQKIASRKPVQDHKDLRGRIRIYDKDYLGKSDLDHHRDFEKKMNSVQCDRPRVLNLMRGFVFWLMMVRPLLPSMLRLSCPLVQFNF
ncbi:Required to maintain repression 2 [Quillaja saponaria]|uniref:Required to maintain repression 2 n=1 Tax=Quillaja saponaria TaxID=32244 RepID=A0AAD7LGR9_QUISA|nr:Required to maintain repression 2 [Quillaja saponaria]